MVSYTHPLGAPKILILGHGAHGKDTVAEFLSEISGLVFESSSLAASEIVVYPLLKDKYGYKSASECFDDRRNHREEWKQAITNYNTPDKSRLCREILERRNGYIGMRCDEEYAASVDLFDHVLYVDASHRAQSDPTMMIERDDRMTVIDNNGSIEDMQHNVLVWAREVGLCY